MLCRKATLNDLCRIMQIINGAIANLRDQGSNQWQNGYPNEEVLRADIENENCVVCVSDDTIVGLAVIIFGEDPSYGEIDGAWLSDLPYASVHRVATSTDARGKGISSAIIAYCEELCVSNGTMSIRMDTHEVNLPMRALLKKLNYTECGVIHLKNNEVDNARFAYEKLLK